MSQTLYKRLIYIYIGTLNYDVDINFYANVLGAELIWEFENFGAKVAAFDLCGGPHLLTADHIKSPSKRLIYEVENIDDTSKKLEAKGWKADGNLKYRIEPASTLKIKVVMNMLFYK
ncbi:MAG: VOC family protein [Chitinophagaceae bacterium]